MDSITTEDGAITDRVAKVAISNRIHPDNYFWLRETAKKMERSANWLLDKTLTEAREADNAHKH